MTRPPSSLTFRNPVNSSKLSIRGWLIFSRCLKPKPQALTNGATVMSKAPPDHSEISMALLKQETNRGSSSTGRFILTFEICEAVSKVEKIAFRRASSSSISA